MRTRRGLAYSVPSLHPPDSNSCSSRPSKRARLCLRLRDGDASSSANSSVNTFLRNPFDSLPDDLLLSIFVCLGATASSPSDLLAAKRTCKKFRTMATNPMVLEKASLAALQIPADKWDDDAKAYLQSCADAGNAEACYSLGMIRFYCLTEREEGIMLMTKSAKAGHPSALHSLAVIQFNGSGGARKHKNLKAGVSLCARAAAAGHIDAMRELGHCLQDGYGIAKNVLEGRRLLLEANAREVAAAAVSSGASAISAPLSPSPPPPSDPSAPAANCLLRRHLLCTTSDPATAEKLAPPSSDAAAASRLLLPIYKVLHHGGGGACSSLLSDFGCNVPLPDLHPCHSFLVRWFSALHPPAAGLRLCSHHHCGRPETRRHEFRRCSACGNVNYCSRACQALDWKLRHKFVCVPAANWQNNNNGGGLGVAAEGPNGGGAGDPQAGAPAAPDQQQHILAQHQQHHHHHLRHILHRRILHHQAQLLQAHNINHNHQQSPIQRLLQQQQQQIHPPPPATAAAQNHNYHHQSQPEQQLLHRHFQEEQLLPPPHHHYL